MRAAPDGDVEPLWRSRVRWRFRGALLWPAFWVLTLADALLLGCLPIAGDGGTAFVPALLLSGFFNLVAVAIVAPLAGLVLRRRRRDLPRVIAFDRAGTNAVPPSPAIGSRPSSSASRTVRTTKAGHSSAPRSRQRNRDRQRDSTSMPSG